MALTPRMEIRQSQGLVMTPQLMQSIKLLQLSNLELAAFVDAELERNPLIERIEGSALESPERRETLSTEAVLVDNTSSEPAENESADWMSSALETSAEAISEKFDASLENVFPDDSEQVLVQKPVAGSTADPDQWSRMPGYSTASSEDYNLETFVANKITLRDHLAGQLSLTGAEPQMMLVARDLLDHVDESGYVRGDLQSIAKRLGVDIAQVKEALKLVQTFEPVGICARDLSECLRLQLSEKDRLDPAMQALTENLDLLAQRDFVELGKICAVDRDDLVDMMQEIQALDPKPGTMFEHGAMRPVVPDVIVSLANDGSWKVELNTETLPRILVNQSYFATVSKSASSEHEIEFLNDCLQTANWLHKSLDQRAQTILKVASEIVRTQDEFLLRGVHYLRPLNLRTIADAIGMHESTVSRVTSNKYMLTGRGIFELKYFFTTAIQSIGDNEAFSAESVRHKIRQMIDNEIAKNVLSDDKIVAILRDEGIDIARRTVAKYREALHIPSSVQRRREKKALAGIK